MPGTEGAVLSLGQQGHRRRECSQPLQKLQCLEESLVTDPQRIAPGTLVRPSHKARAIPMVSLPVASPAWLPCSVPQPSASTRPNPREKPEPSLARASVWPGPRKNAHHQSDSRRNALRGHVLGRCLGSVGRAGQKLGFAEDPTQTLNSSEKE